MTSSANATGNGTYEDPNFQIEVPLRDNFRFVHEPIHAHIADRFVGRSRDLEELVHRIRFSEGGSFLITGYRGVGKSSFVNQVLGKLDQETLLLDVQINLARPIQPSELMHLIVRHLYNRLNEKDIYRHLSSSLKTQLSLAYQRTSANVVRKLSDGREVGIETGEIKTVSHGFPFAPKITAKRSRLVDLETSFLAYDDKAAEHDVISLSRELTHGVLLRNNRLRSLVDVVLRRPIQRTKLKIVFVFDEMDKLEDFKAENAERNVVDDLLANLKNLFTTSGISFVFVAGKELHERWLNDMWRGDSIYESVFAYDKYLNCMWDDVDALCGGLTAFDDFGGSPEPRSQQRAIFQKFKNYLRFKGRGIPRRVLRSFNEMVRWRSGKPILAFTNEDLRRVTFYADLNLLIETQSTRLFGRMGEDAAGTRQDRRKLGVYYVIDWILRQGNTAFTAGDILSASRRLSSQIALAEEVAVGAIDELIEVLTTGEYIQPVKLRLDEVDIGVEPVSDQKRYRLTSRRLAEISGLESSFEGESAGFSPGAVPDTLGPYEIHDQIGTGGMATVYRAWDKDRKNSVAIKVLHPWLAADPLARERFRREFRELESLRHENIVRLYESGESNNRCYFAMDLIEGMDLSAILRSRGRLAYGTAAGILLPVAGAADYCHERDLVRLDLKPSNILITNSGHVRLTDFGIVKKLVSEDVLDVRITRDAQIVGTPIYMSPEQIKGEDIDRRSDIFSFGTILYEAVTGKVPFGGKEDFTVFNSILTDSPPPPSAFMPVPKEIDYLIMRCLEKQPEDRFQTMAEVVQTLRPWFPPNPTERLASLVNESRHKARHEAERQDTLRVKKSPGGKARQDTRIEGSPDNVPLPAQTTIPDLRPPSPTQAAPAREPELTQANRSRPVTESTGVFAPIPTDSIIAQPSSASTTLRLVYAQSGETAWITDSTATEFTIGRAQECEIQLSDVPAMSRYQARIVRKGDSFILIDLNSSNGTYLNGSRVLDFAPLSNNDVIRIGKIDLLFHDH